MRFAEPGEATRAEYELHSSVGEYILDKAWSVRLEVAGIVGRGTGNTTKTLEERDPDELFADAVNRTLGEQLGRSMAMDDLASFHER